MTIDLYYKPGSAPCRSVWILSKVLGVELNLKETNLGAGEHLKPEYIKMNPQHTIPTMVDGDFILWESRAILGYLANKYGKDDKLYPTDPIKRARVDQKLYFDMGTMYQRFGDYFYPQIFAKAPADPEKLKKIEEAFEFLNTALANSKYAAGDDITIADIALIASVTSFEVMDYSFAKYANVQRWYDDLKANLPNYDLGAEDFRKFVAAMK